MKDGSWDSLISKPPSMTNYSSFSKTSNLKTFPKPFPSSHIVWFKRPLLRLSLASRHLWNVSLRTAVKQLSLLRDSSKAVRPLVIRHTAM